MITRRTLLASASASLLPLPSFAQSGWPDGKVIKGIVPFAAGSATDTIARVYAEQMGRFLGTSIIIENRAGANGLIGADAVAKSPPDGLTLLFGTNSTNAAAPALFKTVPFDHEKDFAPIAYLGSVPLLVAVSNKVEAKTLKELIAYAKANPGKLNFGSSSSSQRVSTEMLMSMGGFKMNLVTYRASPQAVTDLISGQIDVFVADLAVMLPQVQAGTIRALAATSTKRIPQLPDLPTVEEAGGLPGYELIAWFGVFAPAGTPPAIIARLNEAVVKAAATPEVQEKLGKGLGIAVSSSTPAELADNVRREGAKWAKAVADAGIEKQ
ncbi:MAG: tripartite tricarboxylate transporter substrate binding protein [Methylocystis sp.]|nr:tripartite tricarboxylate transporter substrate binding protein [Methylocystis sp.]MCA3583918.1 tripartite tricarboxylate transporter substrate binding protein [Methylocystis sp.]MCA3588427.1 tripartite tricarboxylate transporter substrate binding protein [Methylocystis sp.]MCA3592422.1 tripartite tricarboxylate transporter substrate binding protein [Methylocystis sp.]